ncbi:MAG: hypothetical protein AAGF97_07550 [Planctomycetota bacterium]
MKHEIRPLGPAESVPVFNCEVLIGPAPDDATRVRARVANLAELEVRAESELAALKQIVPLFKQRVAECVAAGKAVPWAKPPLEPTEAEQKRLIAVHL